ncbi:MAG: hypothetical protein M3008_04010 [Chloroflexota bacterium]|nr:hypothetical protein [Chloroflexota bacterium]
MMIVLDASAMIAFLRDERGGAVVETFLTDGIDTCVAHAINLCEVYDDFIQSADDATATAAIADLEDDYRRRLSIPPILLGFQLAPCAVYRLSMRISEEQ